MAVLRSPQGEFYITGLISSAKMQNGKSVPVSMDRTRVGTHEAIAAQRCLKDAVAIVGRSTFFDLRNEETMSMRIFCMGVY